MSTAIDMITVLGPTATGKTTFAAHLALLINGEIISADSRQVYKGMDLGTGKDIDDYTIDGQEVPHHLIDIAEAGDKYNVYEYQSDFLKAYNKVKQNNHLPILCGGTGMYIEAVLKGYKLINVPVNEPLREKLRDKPLNELAKMLSEIKKQHNTSDTDTPKRAIRAIEIALYQNEHKEVDNYFPKINSLLIGIKFDRPTLKHCITERLKQRLHDGMIDEVKQLIEQGVSADDLIYYGLEYKFITQYLQKEFSYNKMVEKLNIAIHQFSKRQMTWYRRMERHGFDIHWIDGHAPLEDKIAKAMQIIQLKS